MRDRERNEETGQFTGSGVYTDEDFLDAIRAVDGPAITKAVADEVGCHRDTARRRLRDLADEERAERTYVADAIVWSVTEGNDGR